MKTTKILFILLMTRAGGINAATLNVPSQYITIQLAINASIPSDTVLVSPNATYFENINFLGKDITVKTPNPVTDRFTTIIDGGGNGSVVKFINSETNNARIQGFTVQNGSGSPHDWWYYLSGVYIAGGGILCDNPYSLNPNAPNIGSSPTISYMIVQNNSAEMGGGICAWLRSIPIIENTIVRNNTASQNGGGLYFIEVFNTSSTPLTLTNVEVTHNTGGTVGGSGIAINYTSKVNIMNCSVSDNTAPVTNGEALWRANGAFFEIYNSIFWNLSSDLIYDDGGTGATSTIDYSDASNTLGPLIAGSNMLTVNPAFVNPAANNYHLSSGSPCIDAGTAINAPAYDLDGNLRNAIPDIGAYEYISSASIEVLQENYVNIFPNPVNDQLIIINSNQINELELTDISGKLIRSVKLNSSGKTIMDISDLNTGCYFININNKFFLQRSPYGQKIIKL